MYADEISIELIRANTRDVETYIALEKSLGDLKTYSTITNKADVLKELEKTFVYFIKNNNKIIGHTAYEMKQNDQAYITSLVVIPEYQNKGIATIALKKLLAKLTSIKVIDLVTHPENFKAIKIYESLGFKLSTKYENYFGDGEPRVRLVLEK